MKSYFAYIRVSTVRQGEGTSLSEQRAVIERYAAERDLPIVCWFEETETAAKRGRGVFRDVLARLERDDAQGLIVHKIDRSARNLRDWADLGELIDRGIDVRFANDNLDLETRAGRLAADIQAVIAADYIRNLREEVLKGLDGRLRQGLYPGPAPLGYQDRGRGQVKVPDPIRAPLITEAFELYGSGKWSVNTLAAHMGERGLLGAGGKPISHGALHRILRNPFYAGSMKLGARPAFPGIHRALISKELYETTQALLGNKKRRTRRRHQFLYQQRIVCAKCGRLAIGELIKGRYTYYRCHGRECPKTIAREDVVDQAVADALLLMSFPPTEELQTLIAPLRQHWLSDLASSEAKRLHVGKAAPRLALAIERTHSVRLRADASAASLLDVLSRPELLFRRASPAQRTELLDLMGMNFQLSGKLVAQETRRSNDRLNYPATGAPGTLPTSPDRPCHRKSS